MLPEPSLTGLLGFPVCAQAIAATGGVPVSLATSPACGVGRGLPRGSESRDLLPGDCLVGFEGAGDLPEKGNSCHSEDVAELLWGFRLPQLGPSSS